MLWPHTDECDRTAERGEGNKSHRTNTLMQVTTKALGGEDGEHSQLSSSALLGFSIGKSSHRSHCLFREHAYI